MIKLYNTQSRQKEDFVPLDPEGRRVGFYYCGPTVYDSLHLGHARAAIVPDLIRRYLEYRGYQVRYVANFTDVDDKIIKRSIRERRPWKEITSVYMEEYHRVTAALGNRPPDVQPRATDHIPEMLDLVGRLLEAGNAYVATNGDVYFDTASFATYLALSGRQLEDQESGRSGRLSDEELAVKRHPADFILWKVDRNDPDLFRAHPEAVPSWDSPWGRGRPGWHLECSALSKKYLGMPFDLHGGGRDLIFPHHENEKAQNDCAYCRELDGGVSVRYWVHNAFVTVKAETTAELSDENTEDGAAKMSKSLGNVKWLKDMIWPDGPYDPLAVRLLMLQSHYRSPLQYNADLLDQTQARLDRIYGAAERLRAGLEPEVEGAEPGAVSQATRDATAAAVATFEAGMDDDFNTPRALAAIDELISHGRGLAADAVADRRATAACLDSLCHVLGLRTERPRTGWRAGGEDALQGLLQLLGELRAELRAAKNYELADSVRRRLAALGFELRDAKSGGFEIAPLKRP